MCAPRLLSEENKQPSANLKTSGHCKVRYQNVFEAELTPALDDPTKKVSV